MTLLRTLGTALDPKLNAQLLGECEVEHIDVGDSVRINEPGNLLDGYAGTLERVQDNGASWVLVNGFPLQKVQTINLVKTGK